MHKVQSDNLEQHKFQMTFAFDVKVKGEKREHCELTLNSPDADIVEVVEKLESTKQANANFKVKKQSETSNIEEIKRRIQATQCVVLIERCPIPSSTHSKNKTRGNT